MKKYEKPVVDEENIKLEDICMLSGGNDANLSNDDTESGSLGGLGLFPEVKK